MTVTPLRALALSFSILALAACGQSSPEAAEDAGGGEAVAAEAAGQSAAPALPEAGALEVGFDRPGHDLRLIEGVETAEACQAACQDEAQCVAFTWVQPGVQADTANCWLKDQLPGTLEAECCTSGVIADRIETTPEEG